MTYPTEWYNNHIYNPLAMLLHSMQSLNFDAFCKDIDNLGEEERNRRLRCLQMVKKESNRIAEIANDLGVFYQRMTADE